MIVHDYVTHVMKLKTLNDALAASQVAGTFLRSGFKARKSKDFKKGDLAVIAEHGRLDVGIITKVNKSTVKMDNIGYVCNNHVDGRIDIEGVYKVLRTAEKYDALRKTVEDHLIMINCTIGKVDRLNHKKVFELLAQFVDIRAFLTKIDEGRWCDNT